MKVRTLAIGLVVLGALLGASPIAAVEVDSERFRSLARQARTDPGALTELRSVDRVDGRPMDVGRALEGADGEELAERLEVLAGDVGGDEVDAEALRTRAGEILASDRYRDTAERGGLAAFLGRIADWFGDVAQSLPLGAWVLWGVVAAVVIAGTVALTSFLAGRRGAEVERVGRVGSPGGGGGDDPRTLEEEARRAERDGDLVGAIRLLFRAGFLRLDAEGVLRLRPSLTVGEAARRLRMGTFDRLARLFDEVVYGGRAPSAKQVGAVRRAWERVLEEARR